MRYPYVCHWSDMHVNSGDMSYDLSQQGQKGYQKIILRPPPPPNAKSIIGATAAVLGVGAYTLLKAIQKQQQNAFAKIQAEQEALESQEQQPQTCHTDGSHNVSRMEHGVRPDGLRAAL